MKKWEEQNRAKAHQKRVSSAKATVSKTANTNLQVLNVKSPSNLGKEQFTHSDHPDSYPSPFQSTDGSLSTRPPSSKISDYYEFEKENLTNIPLYKLLKHHTLQQYAKALISRGYGYDLLKLIALSKEELNNLCADIKIMPGHKFKFTKMVSQINEIYSEMVEQDPDRPRRGLTLDKGLHTVAKPTTAQTTRNMNPRPMSGVARNQFNKPSSANPGIRRQVQSKPATSHQTRRQNPSMGHIPNVQTQGYQPHMIRKIQAIGLDYFSDSQESMDNDFSQALSSILKQYEDEDPVPSEPKKVTPRNQPQIQTTGTQNKTKPAEKPSEDLMTKVDKMYNNKETKPATTTHTTHTTHKPKPSQPPVEEKSKEKPKPQVSNPPTTKKPAEVIKKAAVTADDLDIPKKGRIMDLLEKKLDSNHLNRDDLNLEFKKIKDMYSSFEGATMTSTIANIDIEEMCYCFACAIQKHIEYFIQNILPTYTPLQTRPIRKEPEPQQNLSGRSITIDNQSEADSCGIEYEEGNSYFVYKGQKIPKGKPTLPPQEAENESLVNVRQMKFNGEEDDEVMIAESGNAIADEEEKQAGERLEREQPSEEVLYEDNGEYNEEKFQDFLRQSLRHSMLASGTKKDYYPTESDLIKKYNLDVPFQPVTTNWNVVDDDDEKSNRDRFTQSQSVKASNDDEDEPEEDIPDDDNEDEERDEAKITKSYFSFEESQFIDVELSAQEMDLQKRTRLVFEKTFNERNLTSEEITKRIGDTVNNSVISNFCKNLMVTTKMEKEVVIVSLVYVERLILKTNMYLTSLNWKRICFTAFVISSKIWDDESFENQHFAKVFPQYSIKEINELEKVFLESIDYDLRVSGSDYAKYYFIMRNFAEKNKKSFSLKALNVQTVRLLQKKAEATAKSLKEIHGDPLNRTFA